MAKERLTPIEGGGRLGGSLEVAEPPEQRRKTNRPPVKTASQLTEQDTASALASMPETSDLAAVAEVPLREAVTAIRDKILRLKSSRPYWERLDYAHRLMLNGALSLSQELLGDTDDAGLPLTLTRFLGIQLPR